MRVRSIACRIISVLLLGVFITGCALAETDDKWSYSQEIVVTENAGKDLTSYQVPVRLDSSNFDFSKANADGSDLRFLLGSTGLDYWVETWDPKGGEATVWVKVPFLPANGNRKILMKYGYPEARAESNGADTFLFFDDFSGSSLRSIDWKYENSGGGFVDVQGGSCKLVAPKVHVSDFVLIYSRDSFDINTAFVAKRMKVTTGDDERGPVLRQGFIDQIDNARNEIKHETELANETRVRWELTARKERFRSFDLTNVRALEGDWYISEIAWYEEDDDNRSVAWFKDGVRDTRMDYTSSEFVTNLPMHIYLYAASYPDASETTGYMAVDYVFIRKFVGPEEPSVQVTPAPAEEAAPVEEVSEPEAVEVPVEEVEVPIEDVSEPENVSEETEEEIEEAEVEAVPVVSFPEYSVGISGIRLSSPYSPHFPALVRDLESSGIDTIFLSVDSTDVWQYERFVKSAHEEGFEVHAVLLEDTGCTGAWDLNTSSEAIDEVLDYNSKSLAAFDGINIYMEPSSAPTSNEGCLDYASIIEATREGAGANLTLSASLPPLYNASTIEDIAPMVDFFVVRAYGRGDGDLNEASLIVDAVALQMGEIRGAGSKGIIEIRAEDGFEDKMAVQESFASLAEYYSGDPAFLGVTISSYETYKDLPKVAEEPDEKPGTGVPGFGIVSGLLAGLGALALLKKSRM
ncbi:DUF2341 domain-containing protein [Methanosarcina sp. MTP4]|uniref:DUF2341 domain-containing protein n=1 Tax=Methanosarcina sp. MTP4 TaxID=1434100 RepID=UPI00064EF75A|nr:DUF2341 domain-containing protein [Methanosarcina sp. MTP4]